jgi:hypothetical protein
VLFLSLCRRAIVTLRDGRTTGPAWKTTTGERPTPTTPANSRQDPDGVRYATEGMWQPPIGSMTAADRSSSTQKRLFSSAEAAAPAMSSAATRVGGHNVTASWLLTLEIRDDEIGLAANDATGKTIRNIIRMMYDVKRWNLFDGWDRAAWVIRPPAGAHRRPASRSPAHYGRACFFVIDRLRLKHRPPLKRSNMPNPTT